MKKSMIAAASLAALVLAACGQAEAPAPEAEADAPQGLMAQAQALPREQQPVFAWQLLSARTDLDPPCASVRGAEPRGIVPEDVAPESIYAPFVGSLAFAVQCGPQLTTVRDDPHEHWLVVLEPGASEAVIVSCADASGADRCLGPIPQTAPAP